MRRSLSTIALALYALVGTDVYAQSVSAPDNEEAEGPDLEIDPSWVWSVEVKPMLWSPGLNGDFSLPASSLVNVKSLNMDETRLAPAGQLSLRADRLVVRFRGFGFSLDESEGASGAFTLGGLAVAPGDRVSSEIDFSSFDITVGYRVWTPIEDVDRDVRMGFDLYGGLRVDSMSIELHTATTMASGDQTWFQPIVGLQMTIDLPQRFMVYASVDLGGIALGDNSATSFDITTGIQWRFHDNVGIEWGFRHHQFNLESEVSAGDFDFDGSLAGLYGAIVIRF